MIGSGIRLISLSGTLQAEIKYVAEANNIMMMYPLAEANGNSNERKLLEGLLYGK